MAPDVTYENVLVPTDGSETAGNAVGHAISLADRYGATLHGVSVIDTAALGSTMDAALIHDALEDRARADLQAIEERATAAGIDRVETDLRQGSPHRGILDYAEEHDVDLIVMGTHGRRGLDRYLLGSVTEKVVRLSPVPVLTVQADPEDREDGEA